uniref:beta-ketoacyl-[acyl-carrier-protein] synthase I n=1 Tax=Arundo donax TaxID=35708 RepID=A0A0A9D093_ARUDO
MSSLFRRAGLLPAVLRLRRGLSSASAAEAEVFPPPRPGAGRRVVVTGLGAVTPLGCGAGRTWDRLVSGECGVRALATEDLRLPGDDAEAAGRTLKQLPSRVVAAVPRGKGEAEFDEEAWTKGNKSVSGFIAYALCAADEALRDANWLPLEEEKKERTGVSIGGGIGSISDILEASQMIIENRLRRLSPYFIPKILINMASGHVSMTYGFQGPNHAAVTACATGAHSIGDATRMIQFGDADVMVAGGTESSIDALSIAGFSRLRALTTKYNSLPEAASRPFDCGRDGFVIGEGCGVMVLEALDHANERGAKIYAEVRGYGMSGDAHHITQPQNDGRGAILAMKRALDQSGLRADEINYLNAHATSTPLGDAVEANAIKSVFGDHVTSGGLAFSSTKGAIGHLLGAAGSVEAIFSVLAIHHGVAPPTLNLEQPDPLFEGAFMPLAVSKKDAHTSGYLELFRVWWNQHVAAVLMCAIV